VTKRSTKNVFIFFQGGGVCWDQDSFDQAKCRIRTVSPNEIGVLDHTDSSNPFVDYTSVTIPYCTGDFFFGNTSGSYYDTEGNLIHYKGMINTLFVLNWLMKQQQMGGGGGGGGGGYLQYPTLDRLVLGGSSAGSIGVQIWSDKFLNAIPAFFTGVIADSLLTYSAPQFESGLFDQWDFCHSILLPTEFSSLCSSSSSSSVSDGTIPIPTDATPSASSPAVVEEGEEARQRHLRRYDDDEGGIDQRTYRNRPPPQASDSISASPSNQLRFLDLVIALMNKHPKTVYMYVTSKRDSGALDVYNDFSVTYGGEVVTGSSYYTINSHNFETLKQSLNTNNLLLYFVSSSNHVYLNRDILFTTTPINPLGPLTNIGAGEVPLYQWLQVFHPNRTQPVVCGQQGNGCVPWSQLGITSQCDGTDCSSILFPH
jgi:hypothetical protein